MYWVLEWMLKSWQVQLKHLWQAILSSCFPPMAGQELIFWTPERLGLTPLLLFFYLQKLFSEAPAPDTDLSVIHDDPDLALLTTTSLLPCPESPCLGPSDTHIHVQACRGSWMPPVWLENPSAIPFSLQASLIPQTEVSKGFICCCQVYSHNSKCC